MSVKMESGPGWKWYGYPVHYICGSRCVFHLGTRIGNYLISTLGDQREVNKGVETFETREYHTVGFNRKYETMVFRCDGDDKNGDPNSESSEIDFAPYNPSIDAERGHYEMCWKYHEISIRERIAELQ